MRLKLVAKTPMTDPAEKGWRLLERGELTLGRSPGCGWRLDDPDRTISKLHCRIVRQGGGFALRDESVNGMTVDGAELAEGQTAPLANGSEIRIGDFAFAVEITGAEEPDWSDPDPSLTPADDDLTVTSIISDVSPGGSTATGALPGHVGDQWIAAQTVRDPERLDSAERLRDAPIGWDGPPDLKLVTPALPADWDVISESAPQNEHIPATGVRVRLAKAEEAAPEPRPEPAPPSRDEADRLIGAFLAGARLPPSAPADPHAYLRALGASLRAAMDQVSAIEATTADFLAEHGVERTRASDAADPAALAGRLDRVAEDLRLTQAAVTVALDDFTQRFEPRAIEARADANVAKRPIARLFGGVPLLAERGYWAAYRETYGGRSGAGGVRGRFREALGGGEPVASADGFEELKSDSSRPGGAA